MRKFEKHALNEIRLRIREVLRPVELEHGLNIDIGNITYTSDRFHVRLDARLSTALPIEARDYIEIQDRDSMLPRLNSIILLDGALYQIVGWKRRSRKRPVVIQTTGGTRLKTTVAVIYAAEVVQQGE